jgi:hypothetical protein
MVLLEVVAQLLTALLLPLVRTFAVHRQRGIVR